MNRFLGKAKVISAFKTAQPLPALTVALTVKLDGAASGRILLEETFQRDPLPHLGVKPDHEVSASANEGVRQ